MSKISHSTDTIRKQYRYKDLFFSVACAATVMFLLFCGPRDPIASLRPRKTAIQADNIKTTATPPDDTYLSLSARLNRIIGTYVQKTGDTALAAYPEFDKILDSTSSFIMSRTGAARNMRHIIAELNSVIFGQWSIAFDNDRNNILHLFPHLIFREKKGSCVGMSLIYLLLAEKTGLPLYAVLAPSHMFVRYDDGTGKYNIETLRKGENMSNEWYIRRYGITDTFLYPLRNLNIREVEAVVWYNLGTIEYNKQCYKRAIEFLSYSSELMPYFPEAKGNTALALDACGETDSALSILLSLRKKFPTLENIDRNIAAIQIKKGDYHGALISFTAACDKNPGDAESHFGRGVALYHLKRNYEAAGEFRKAIRIDPKHRQAIKYLQKTGK